MSVDDSPAPMEPVLTTEDMPLKKLYHYQYFLAKIARTERVRDEISIIVDRI